MAVIGDSEADSVAGALGRLTAKSLLLSDTSDPVTRYRLLDTTRTYSRIKLMDSGEYAATCRRHAGFYRDLLAPLVAPRTGGQGMPASPDLYMANVRVALEWAFSPTGDRRLGIEIAAGAVQLMLDQSLLREAREQAERALGVLGADLRGSRYEMTLSASLGHALMLTGDHDGAVAALERALAIARGQEDRAYEFRLLNSLHIFHRRMGRFGQLVPFATSALAIAKSLLDAELIRATDQMLAASYHLVGDQAASHALFRACLHMGDDSLYTTPTFLGSNVEVLFVLARVLWLRGFPDQAAATLQTAEQTAQTDPMSACQARALALGFHALTRDWAALESCVEQQLAATREHALIPFEFAALAFRGEILVRRGDFEAGVTQLRASIGWLSSQRFMLYISWFSAALAEGLAGRGYIDQALTVIQEQVAEVERLGGAYNLPELLRVRGELFREAGDPAAAFESFGALMALAEKQTALSWQLRTATSIARLRLSQGRADEAYAALMAIFERFTEGFGTVDLQSAQRLLHQLKYGADS